MKDFSGREHVSSITTCSTGAMSGTKHKHWCCLVSGKGKNEGDCNCTAERLITDSEILDWLEAKKLWLAFPDEKLVKLNRLDIANAIRRERK